MNKTSQRRLNLFFGLALSALLICLLYKQVTVQLAEVRRQTGGDITRLGDIVHLTPVWLCAALGLLPLNLGLEALRWQMLASTAQPITFRQALASYLAGIAGSVITPNRIGEYPARIFYLKRESTYRLATVAILGATAQMLALFLFGSIGFAYYLTVQPAWWARALAVGCVIGLIIIALLYFCFEAWLPRLQRWKWAARFVVYGGALMRFPRKKSWNILLLSVLRFVVFTAQYLLLMQWMGVDVPVGAGFCLTALFFWAMAVIPSVALAELGLRGQVSLFLFGAFSQNTIGILGAALVLWGINLVLPALAGSLLLWRVRLLR